MRSIVDRHPSRLRRHLARPAIVLAAVGIVGAAGIAAAAAPGPDPQPGTSFGRQVTSLTAGPATRARDRASGLARALGLRGLPTEVRQVRDAMLIDRTFEEVTLAEGRRHTGLVVHDGRTGRPVSVANLTWTPGDDTPRTDRAAAPLTAARLARAAGLAVPSEQPTVRWDEAADAWEVGWTRLVAGIPAPSDGLTLRLRPAGGLASLSAQEAPLAERPARLIPVEAALAVARDFAAEHGLDRFDGFRLADRGLAWSEANGFVTGAATFEPTLRLCRVVHIAFRQAGDSSTSLVELRIDAGSGAIVGGDQTS